mgnify:CR=1 FL=1
MLGFTYNFGYYPHFNTFPLSTSTETAYIDVSIYCAFYNKIVLTWNIPARWGACTFNVYRGETELGPWDKLNPTPLSSSTNFFEDITTNDFSMFINGYYVIEVTLPSGNSIRSASSTWHNKRTTWVELRAREIIRRETWLLNKFTGIESLIFKRKTFGERCPNCWNYDIEKVTLDHCEVCLGTSFDGGYFPGYRPLVQYDPIPNTPQFSYQGKTENNLITAWTVDFPEINAFDLVLRVPDWRLYRVEAIQSTELQTVTVRQVFQLNELDKNSIEFNLAEQALLP